MLRRLTHDALIAVRRFEHRLARFLQKRLVKVSESLSDVLMSAQRERAQLRLLPVELRDPVRAEEHVPSAFKFGGSHLRFPRGIEEVPQAKRFAFPSGLVVRGPLIDRLCTLFPARRALAE